MSQWTFPKILYADTARAIAPRQVPVLAHEQGILGLICEPRVAEPSALGGIGEHIMVFLLVFLHSFQDSGVDFPNRLNQNPVDEISSIGTKFG